MSENFKCVHCEKSFTNRRHHELHVNGHLRNSCQTCGLLCNSRKTLAAHMSTVHGSKLEPVVLECRYCVKTFVQKRSLHLHYKTVHKDTGTICPECGQPFNNKLELSNHLKTVKHADGFVCHKCGETFTRNQQYILHLQRHDTYCCYNCTTQFANSKKLNSHLKQCVSTVNKLELSDHEKTVKHGDGFVCHKCGEKFTRSQQYKLHLQTHDIHCYNCTAEFTNYRKLNKHLKQCVSVPLVNNHTKNKEAVPDIIYECKDCKKSFKKKKYYKRHMKRVIHSNNKVDDIFYCAHCPKMFYYKFNLSSHLKLVHFKSNNNYICNWCGQSFQYKNNYKRHRDSHMEVRNYVCEECGACFYRKHALLDHQVAKHRDDKNFVCNVCGNVFKLKSILTRHMKNHSETKKYSCHCKRVFKFLFNLRRHQTTVHNQTYTKSTKVKRFIEDNSRSSPLAVINEEKKVQKLKEKSFNQISLEDSVSYSIMEYSDNLDLSSVDIAESVLQEASSSNYKIDCEESSCFPGIHPPIETSLVCSLNDGTDLSPNSSNQYLSDYVIPHQFPFLNI